MPRTLPTDRETGCQVQSAFHAARAEARVILIGGHAARDAKMAPVGRTVAPAPWEQHQPRVAMQLIV